MFHNTSRKMDFSFLKINQLKLFLSGQLLNPVFPAHCLFLRGIRLTVYQPDRSFLARIFGSFFPGIMFFESFFQTICPPGIKTAISTFYHISKQVFHLSSLLCKERQSMCSAALFSIMKKSGSRFESKPRSETVMFVTADTKWGQWVLHCVSLQNINSCLPWYSISSERQQSQSQFLL